MALEGKKKCSRQVLLTRVTAVSSIKQTQSSWQSPPFPGLHGLKLYGANKYTSQLINIVTRVLPKISPSKPPKCIYVTDSENLLYICASLISMQILQRVYGYYDGKTHDSNSSLTVYRYYFTFPYDRKLWGTVSPCCCDDMCQGRKHCFSGEWYRGEVYTC